MNTKTAIVISAEHTVSQSDAIQTASEQVSLGRTRRIGCRWSGF